jgi:hypothetical protein
VKNIKTYEDFYNEEINLKKGLAGAALGAGLAFSNPSSGQITTTKIATEQVPQQKYDSLSNFVGDNIKSIINQTIYLKPIPESLREYGYQGFFTQPDKDF